MVELDIVGKILSQPLVNFQPNLCLKFRYKNSKCKLCIENCPLKAITLNDPLKVNSICNGCGICTNLCPTGAFELRKLSFERLLQKMRNRKMAVFACSLSPNSRGNIEVPCLGFLNETVLVGAALSGVENIWLNASQCKGCEFKLGLNVALKSVKNANEILDIFGKEKKIFVSSEANNLVDGYSRREFFSYLREEATNVASNITTTVTEALIAEVPIKDFTKKRFIPRLPEKRALLLKLFKELGKPVTDKINVDELPFSKVEIDKSCKGCDLCVILCPTGALSRYDNEDKAIICIKLAYCTKCGLCSEVCPEGVIKHSSYVNPHDLLDDKRKVLIQLEKSKCSKCGNSYISQKGENLCLSCKKEKELIESLSTFMAH
ncbi:MAG: 4Fe-4S binding protein [Euryarchaeota archaeon]|nr:4Fe-4S binding protein [Euryarchaeota archaeon]